MAGQKRPFASLTEIPSWPKKRMKAFGKNQQLHDTKERARELNMSESSSRELAILAVEDVQDDVELIRLQVRRDGYVPVVRRVDHAAAMRAALAERRWDVITADYRMPHFDTAAALAIRSEVDPDLPFIVVSGSIGESAAVSAMKAGASDYVMKDNLARLVPAIERELRDAEVRRARRRADEELRRLVNELALAVRVRDDFLTVASHELRTPLTALMLTLEGALRSQKGETAQGLVSRIVRAHRQTLRLNELVDILLTVSRLREAAPTLDLRRADLAVIVDETLEQIGELAEHNSCPLRMNIARNLVGRFDQLQIKQVLTNLVSNAVKYGPGKPLEVTLVREADRGALTVRDYGIGIPSEDQERIFDRFERAVPLQNYGGLGLGLWLSRRIIEAHGGSIGVDSKPGQGATFTVRLPLEPALEQLAGAAFA